MELLKGVRDGKGKASEKDAMAEFVRLVEGMFAGEVHNEDQG